MNYTEQLINFINDKESLNQGYVTNEPYALAKQGIDVSYLKVKDSGFANYANVLFTTEKFLEEHPRHRGCGGEGDPGRLGILPGT